MASSALITSIFNYQPHSVIRMKLQRRCCAFPFRSSLSSSKSYHLTSTISSSRPPKIKQFSLLISRKSQASTTSLPKPLSPLPNPKLTLYQLLKCFPEVVYIMKLMDVNDMEIVLSVMKKAGYSEVVEVPESAEIIFINTCAIRDNAEQKVWQRLNYFWFLKRHWKSNVAIGRSESLHPPKVVVLGCMAERLKDKILDAADKMVDVVCGPDAYRDLPRLLEGVEYGQKGINTLLSLASQY